MVESGSVVQVVIQGDHITGDSAQGPFKTYAPKDPELIQLLRNKGVQIAAKPPEESPWFQVLLSWVPMLLLIGVWIFFMRQMQGGRRQGPLLRKEQGPSHVRIPGKGDLRGRGRH